MEIAHLVDEISFRLAMALPYISIDTATARPEASRHVDSVTLKEATAFWGRLIPISASHPDLRQAAERLATQPSPEALAEFQNILVYLLTIERQLYADLYDLLRFHGVPPSQDTAALTRSDGQRTWIYFSRVMLISIAGAIAAYFVRNIAESTGRGTPGAIVTVGIGILITIVLSTYLASFRGMSRPVFVGNAAVFPAAYLISALGLFFFLRADQGLGRTTGKISRHGRWMMIIQALPILLLLLVGPMNWDYYTYFFNNIIGFLLFLVMFFAWLLSGAALYIGYWQGRATDGLMFGTISALTGFMMLLTTWCILLGPAVGRIFTEF